MPSSIKTYLIYVVDNASEPEKEWAKKARAKRNHANFRNARNFEYESCDGVVLGKGVAESYPQIKEAYDKEGIEVEDLDADSSDTDAGESETSEIKPEPSDNVYEWTRQECLDWLKANEVEVPSDGYQSRSDLQTLVLENIGNG